MLSLSVCLSPWLLMGDLFVSGTERLKVKRVCRPLPASYQCSADKSLSVLMIGTQGVCV